jgi:hypothetical protein
LFYFRWLIDCLCDISGYSVCFRFKWRLAIYCGNSDSFFLVHGAYVCDGSVRLIDGRCVVEIVVMRVGYMVMSSGSGSGSGSGSDCGV